jgi:hypothetical protein
LTSAGWSFSRSRAFLRKLYKVSLDLLHRYRYILSSVLSSDAYPTRRYSQRVPEAQVRLPKQAPAEEHAGPSTGPSTLAHQRLYFWPYHVFTDVEGSSPFKRQIRVSHAIDSIASRFVLSQIYCATRPRPRSAGKSMWSRAEDRSCMTMQGNHANAQTRRSFQALDKGVLRGNSGGSQG